MVCQARSKTQILQQLLAVEQRSHHPLAQAIATYADIGRKIQESASGNQVCWPPRWGRVGEDRGDSDCSRVDRICTASAQATISSIKQNLWVAAKWSYCGRAHWRSTQSRCSHWWSGYDQRRKSLFGHCSRWELFQWWLVVIPNLWLRR